jgi:hypothetical protein
VDNIDRNTLGTTDLNRIGELYQGGAVQFYQWLQAMQADMVSLPNVSTLVNGNFPSTPASGIGLLFLTSGTYEVAAVNSWRRLYDAALFATGAVAP